MIVDLIESKAETAALLLVALVAVLGIYAAKGLYANGFILLLSILSQKDYFDFDTPRTFSQTITQTPVLLGVKLGAKDLAGLIYLHSFRVIGIPVII